jgi:hypothetical protein
LNDGENMSALIATQSPYPGGNSRPRAAFCRDEMVQEQPMRLNIVFLALGAFIAGAAPFAARAQMVGDALANAEKTCLDNGVGPHSVTFDACVAHAAHAYLHDRPQQAVIEARRISDAHRACLSYDIEPQTMRYHQCLADETKRARQPISYVPGADR